MNCPNCDSHSGVDVHGRMFCHACKLNFPGNRKNLFTITNSKMSLALPIANNDALPTECFDWLDDYDMWWTLTGIFYSKEYKRLCFPYYINNEIKACWMRDFDTNSYSQEILKPKWLFVGSKDILWHYNKPYQNQLPKTLILVEDIVSALKLSMYYNTLCLGGTGLPQNILSILDQYDNILIFLDGDRAGLEGALKLRNKLKLIKDTKVIYAKKDPKKYSYDELRGIIL